MKVEIELIEGSSTETQFTGWKVTYGEKYAYGLGYDEMLGLVAAITLPENRPTLNWLKTKEQHDAWRSRINKMTNSDVSTEMAQNPMLAEGLAVVAAKAVTNNYKPSCHAAKPSVRRMASIKNEKMKWIIVDLILKTALYGVDEKTLHFSSKEIAYEVASQFFKHEEHYCVVAVMNW